MTVVAISVQHLIERLGCDFAFANVRYILSGGRRENSDSDGN